MLNQSVSSALAIGKMCQLPRSARKVGQWSGVSVWYARYEGAWAVFVYRALTSECVLYAAGVREGAAYAIAKEWIARETVQQAAEQLSMEYWEEAIS